MASVRTRKTKTGTYYFEVINRSKTVAYKGGYLTQEEAKKAGKVIQEDINISEKGLSSDMSMPAFYRRWKKIKIDSKYLEPSTMQKYEFFHSVLVKYLDKPVHDIRPSEYQEFINEFGKTNSKDILQRMNSVVRQSLELAKNDGLIFNDFTIGVEMNTKKKPKESSKKYIHSLSDYDKLKSYLEKSFKDELFYNHTYIILYFLLETGMRFGELIALTWQDFDEENLTLRTYRRYNTTAKLKKFTPPKTEVAVRNVPISNHQADVLKSWHNRQKEVFELNPWEQEADFIFSDDKAKNNLTSSAVATLTLKKVIKNLKIQPSTLTVYGLRHTRASFLLEKSISVGIIARILGHTVAQFEEVYRHLFTENLETGYEQIRSLDKN